MQRQCAHPFSQRQPMHRGTVIGILKAFLGLSASAYVTLYVSFLDPDAAAFVLMLGILPALLCLLCAPFINYVRTVPMPRTASLIRRRAYCCL